MQSTATASPSPNPNPNPSLNPSLNAATFRSAFLGLKAEKKMRNRDAAAELGVSEGEAIAAFTGENVIRLKGGFPEFMTHIEALGPVMALTRNASVVHEKVGCYEKVSHQGHVGLALGEAIDLRIFYSHWKHGFAVTEESPRGPQRSLQIFDAAGQAVHKIFLKEHSNLEHYLGLVEDWSDENQAPGIEVMPAAPAPLLKPDEEIDAEGFREAWAVMKDTHEFFGLLRKFGVARTQALRLAGAEFAYPVAANASRVMLETAARDGVSIMCFVGNPGIIQIHTGEVKNIQVMGPWLNVLDPEFNLHLREDHINQAWVVRKPTTEGIVTSLELFDAGGETMAMFFGKRKPGIPELPAWRAIAEQLPRV
jgi:putative hemin transport protein